eukprot:CAMPEP_0118885680 /NCGR_PEP_ID=MMETSP1163-20130328/24057_1 /TAXON_ID=124430 /ORGANISM="Phaeomonas parva, Strain CCMP2877" /LENGTH=32 /DNA_ID= /DNA_START= /DNA_END= /DNA_ORIENTATION=
MTASPKSGNIQGREFALSIFLTTSFSCERQGS